MKTILSRALALHLLFAATAIHAQVAQLVNYQGRVAVGTTNFEGTGSFKFALVNAAGTTTFWSNDGTSTAGSQPTAAVTLTVAKGLYSVLLGDTSLTNMTAIPASVFTNADVRLRVWFNDGTNGSQLLTPDQRLAPNGYLPDGSVGSAAIASGAVTSAKIGAGAVQTANLAAGAATSANTAGTLVLRDGSGNFSAGAFNLPSTLNASTGIITQDGSSLLHTFGTGNFFAGLGAGNFTLSGIQNTASGNGALAFNTTGSFNTASGTRALYSNTTGTVNTAIGLQTLFSNTTGSVNTASGVNALFSNTTASQNVAVGNNALHNQSFSNGGVAWNSGNVAVGFDALLSNQPTGTFNGKDNTALGTQALKANTTGFGNTASGSQALTSNITGLGNTASGYQALDSNTAGSANTASGSVALQSNTTGNNNTASGYAALFNNTTGASNTASGYQALFANTTAQQNVAIGVSALSTQSFSNGGVAWNSNNVALGFGALRNNQPTATNRGFNNTASGAEALAQNTTGYLNTADGYQALYSNTGGFANTAIGYQALYLNTGGSSNTAFGSNALSFNTTGESNTAVGENADVAFPGNQINATAIGAGAIAHASNMVRIGNGKVTVIEGQVNFTAASDRTKKENFQPVDGAEVLRKLRGFELTSWNFIGHDPKQFRHYGPMAQDFYAAFGQDAVGVIGTPTTINSGDLAGILMSAVQALDKENAALRVEAAAANKRLAELEARLTKLEQFIPETPKAGAATAALKRGD